MGPILQTIVQVVILASLVKYGLRRFEKGRSFPGGRIWIAACAVVAFYALPALADYLYHWRVVVYPRLPAFLFTFWGSVAWGLSAFPVLFGIQWLVYPAYLKDEDGLPLSRRGNLWIAAIPTVGLMILKFGAGLLMAVVFFLIGLAR